MAQMVHNQHFLGATVSTSDTISRESLIQAGFCRNFTARLARAFGRGFQLATGRHDVLAARFADRAGVTGLVDDLGKGTDAVVG